MTRGRKPKGPQLVEGLDGSLRAKTRLKTILETMAGQCTIEEACQELGIKEAMFHKLRAEVLQTALSSLEPRPAGRPRQPISDENTQITSLAQENEELQLELQAAQIRLELAQTMPYLKTPDPAEKKTHPGRSRREARRRARKRGNSSDSRPDGK